jgi:hypothetical protein
MWIMGLLIVGCVIVVSGVLLLLGEASGWELTLLVMFGVGSLFFVGGRFFPLGTRDSNAY